MFACLSSIGLIFASVGQIFVGSFHGSPGEWLVDVVWVGNIIQESDFLLMVNNLFGLMLLNSQHSHGMWETLFEEGHDIIIFWNSEIGHEVCERWLLLLCHSSFDMHGVESLNHGWLLSLSKDHFVGHIHE
jgi:hypothetical protein